MGCHPKVVGSGQWKRRLKVLGRDEVKAKREMYACQGGVSESE
jgi:hypothetical protein